jgi:hypothetical protein
VTDTSWAARDTAAQTKTKAAVYRFGMGTSSKKVTDTILVRTPSAVKAKKGDCCRRGD